MSNVIQQRAPIQLPPTVAQLPMQLPPGAVPTAPTHSNIGNIVKNVAIFGGIGAAAGFGLSLLPLPFLGWLTGPIGAIAGGVIGAGIGLVKALKENRDAANGASALLPPPPPGS